MQSWQTASVSIAFSNPFPSSLSFSFFHSHSFFSLSSRRENGQNKQQICGAEKLGTGTTTFHNKWKKLEPHFSSSAPLQKSSPRPRFHKLIWDCRLEARVSFGLMLLLSAGLLSGYPPGVVRQPYSTGPQGRREKKMATAKHHDPT